MNKQIGFGKLGGYPLTQDDLGWMQDSYTKAISTIAAAFGQYVILNGVEAQNGYYSEGWIIIDKVLLPFRKSQIAAQIVVNETKNSRLFADGATYDVHFEKYATSANTGGIAFGNFVRMSTVSTIMNNLTTLSNTFATHAHNWDSITGKPATFPPSEHAHNWNSIAEKPATFPPSAHQHSWNDIYDKPAFPQQLILHRGTKEIGDPKDDDTIWTVTFPSVGTSSYIVLGSIVSQSTNYDADNELVFAIKNKTKTSFDIAIRDIARATSDVDFDYVLIKKY